MGALGSQGLASCLNRIVSFTFLLQRLTLDFGDHGLPARRNEQSDGVLSSFFGVVVLIDRNGHFHRVNLQHCIHSVVPKILRIPGRQRLLLGSELPYKSFAIVGRKMADLKIPSQGRLCCRMLRRDHS